MARKTLYGEERPLPYWVRLVKVFDAEDARLRTARPVLMYLDLRGGEFTRSSTSRLADVFDWITKAFRLGFNDLSEYCLEITPIPPDEDELTGGPIPYIQDDWPELQKRSFLWLPVAHDEAEKRYAWQK